MLTSHKVTPAPPRELYSSGGVFWQDGWYLLYKGKITGPFVAESLFKADTEHGALGDVAAAREGFTRWYRLDFLQEQYRSARQLLPVVSASKPLVQKNSEPNLSSWTHVARKQQHIRLTHDELLYWHLTLRGRLRLGKVMGPIEQACKIIATCGVGWYTWFNEASNSVLGHLDEPHLELPRRWLVLVPGWHCKMIYRLARFVLRMEMQNKVRATSPLLAGLLALFPPFAVVYVQRSLNRHWLTHVASYIESSS